ncbi:MOG interacting and ectopic P-granules protein 1 [Frankliniella fusca]|uniref:MOG interacting and ectopic P-granules protein 1 n=1 Tax=Frankliniella fusca TaxID=407009 RepID=A0AAE1GUT3_9NEOP|nr:MOG interacting and ectopic P-granules protein 1 [Frankliniella fusca]
MGDVTADVGENIKEATDKSSPDAEASAKINGDLNGSVNEAMDVDVPEVTPAETSSIKDSSESSEGQEKQDHKQEMGTSNEDEPMDVDNNVSEVPSDLSTKSEVHSESEDHKDGQPNSSVKNGPSANEQKLEDSIVDKNVEDSEMKSDQSDIRDEVSLGKIDNKVSATDGQSNDQPLKESASVSDSEQGGNQESTSKLSLQNGETEERLDESLEGEEAKDLTKDSRKEEETPERGDSEKNEGESEESPDGSSPGKKGKGRKNPAPLSLTPRRSSRNLNKQKSYAEDKEETQERDDGSDIEEIALVDPLAGAGDQQNKENSKSRQASRCSTSNKTIVVNDTKHLAEIASGSKQTKGQKKEPTLVIIDTNSIISGRAPIPVGQNKIANRPGLQITPANLSTSSSSSASSVQQSFSVLPVGGHTQTVFNTSITPMQRKSPVQPPPEKQPVILPSLTDDMYVVEAPSFIVPYVYEKPPIKPLKDFIEDLGEAIKKQKLEDEEKEKEKEESEKKDVKEKEDALKGEGEKDGKDDKDEKDEKDESKKESGGEDKGRDDEKMDVDEEKKSSKDGKEESKEKEKDDTALREGAKTDEKKDEAAKDLSKGDTDKNDDKKPQSYFDNPLGKFFMAIGTNLVQEHVQTDLLRSQKKKRDREGGKGVASTQMAINSLQQTLEFSKENNAPFHLDQKKCDYCSFKTESALVMAHHMETPHMRNYIYRCNFCDKEVRSPHDILFHMEAEHNVRGKLERGPAFHQCPNCPFEDNQKGKLTRHLVSCQKKYRPEKNQEPPIDWEPPAKIPRVSRSRPFPMGAQSVAGMSMPQKPGMVGQPHPLLPKLPAGSTIMGQTNLGQMANSLGRGRGRPPVTGGRFPDLKSTTGLQQQQRLQNPMSSMLYRSSPSGPSQVLVPTSYPIAGNPIYQNSKGQASKLQQQPSISITPLPRQSSGTPPNAHSTGMPAGSNKPGHPSSGGKATFVICEICDGYIKDLEQLRSHMQWVHKVKIHPKMIYNRPPLNCQKCQFRFFTDQGLERHLLGSHGLVTSSMQEAANRGKDGGRCPVCGRVYQWKLLNHVARDHSMTLKPAHLSYKCTVCTATFGMYKQFENHVYSAHSVVAKRVMDKKPGGTTSTSSPSVSRSPAPAQQSDSLLIKPLKINDEITIIPQPTRSARPSPAGRSAPLPAHMQGGKAGDDRQRRPGSGTGREDDGVQIIDLDDSPSKDALSAVQERLRRRTSLEVSQVETTEDDSSTPPSKKPRRD